MNIPFLDLHATHAPLRQELLQRIGDVIDDSALAGGKHVRIFEDAFAEYCETNYAVAVGNGTDALWLTLLAMGIGAGDEVITVPNTFIATAEAISFSGAKPVFVDVDPRTYTLDPALIEAAVTSRTRAIIPVHLYGQMAAMDEIMEIARRHGLKVIEDACQAHGARDRGRRAGSIGDAGCFSFYPGKNLGALGEAGAVTTRDAILAQKIRVLRDHGQEAKYHHSCVGWNARMDGIQGTVLSLKLATLDRDNAARRALAAHYDQQLRDLPLLQLPYARLDGSHVYHLYVVRVLERDELLSAMQQRGVTCGVHYPKPIHLQKAYEGLGLPIGSYPVSEACASTVLSLPIYPTLSREQADYVIEQLTAVLAAAPAPDVRVA